MKRIIGSAAVVAMAAAMFGCSIHTQAPIKEVAYDFSDRDFYDRAYAPSPDYSEPVPVADVSETPGPCPFAASCQGGACGCNRVYVEHHHYHEDDADSREHAPRRRSRPRADAGQDDDTRQAERPARPRVHVEVQADDAGQAPANRASGPARADAPVIGSAPRQAAPSDVRRVQVDIH